MIPELSPEGVTRTKALQGLTSLVGVERVHTSPYEVRKAGSETVPCGPGAWDLIGGES